MNTLSTLILAMFISGLFAAWLAHKKGNSTIKGFLFGFFLGIWGLHYVWVFQNQPTVNNDNHS